MSTQKMVYCTIKIKQESLSWNWNQQNHVLRKQKQEEIQKNYERDFIIVLNTVVDCGGVFCMDRHTLDSEWRLFAREVKIKIPDSSVGKIKSLPELESFIYLG